MYLCSRSYYIDCVEEHANIILIEANIQFFTENIYTPQIYNFKREITVQNQVLKLFIFYLFILIIKIV